MALNDLEALLIRSLLRPSTRPEKLDGPIFCGVVVDVFFLVINRAPSIVGTQSLCSLRVLERAKFRL